ncbi:hypothetical protein Ancab_001904 [Ancistrocladus abbreviatus]
MDLVSETNEEMERMMRKLHLATIEGNVSLLNTLLSEDPLILHKYQLSQANYAPSPLHIASKIGYIEFADKVLCAMPELARELDLNRSSPLHLSCEYGHFEIAKALLNARPDMCLARDLQGRTPLHLAIIMGQLDVVRELVLIMPRAVRERTSFGETILHLCVKHTQLEVLTLLVSEVDDKEILNAKDNEGNTILHLAMADKQLEIIKLLLKNDRVSKNEVNGNGFTAMDIFAQRHSELSTDEDIWVALRRAKLLRAADLRDRNRWANGLMVAASLIAAVAFQAVTNPPGGVWQNQQDLGNGKTAPAGTSVMATLDNYLFNWHIICNTMGLVSSVTIIVLLMSGWAFRRISMRILSVFMCIAITAMLFAYLSAIAFLTAYGDTLIRNFLYNIVLVASAVWATVLIFDQNLRWMVDYFIKLGAKLLGKD